MTESPITKPEADGGVALPQPCAALDDALVMIALYERKLRLLTKEQHRMRDPERTLVCDIIANGQLLPDPNGSRYGQNDKLTHETGSPFPFECENCGHKPTAQEVLDHHGDCSKCRDTVITHAVDAAECIVRLMAATERLNHAEILLSDLARGYWRAILNDQDPSGEGLMGERVAQYWARYCN